MFYSPNLGCFPWNFNQINHDHIPFHYMFFHVFPTVYIFIPNSVRYSIIVYNCAFSIGFIGDRTTYHTWRTAHRLVVLVPMPLDNPRPSTAQRRQPMDNNGRITKCQETINLWRSMKIYEDLWRSMKIYEVYCKFIVSSIMIYNAYHTILNTNIY